MAGFTEEKVVSRPGIELQAAVKAVRRSEEGWRREHVESWARTSGEVPTRARESRVFTTGDPSHELLLNWN